MTLSAITAGVIAAISGAGDQSVVSSLGLAATWLLIGCLVVKELAGASDGWRGGTLSRNLEGPILVLFFVFAFAVAARIIELLA